MPTQFEQTGVLKREVRGTENLRQHHKRRPRAAARADRRERERFSFLALELALNLGSSFAGTVLRQNVSFILGGQWWHSGTLRGHKVRFEHA